jgi:hypothetical protein
MSTPRLTMSHDELRAACKEITDELGPENKVPAYLLKLSTDVFPALSSDMRSGTPAATAAHEFASALGLALAIVAMSVAKPGQQYEAFETLCMQVSIAGNLLVMTGETNGAQHHATH